LLDWLKDPALQSMEPAKRELFTLAATQLAGKPQKSMAPIMMSLITNANKRGITFSQSEISLILKILKQDKPIEQQKAIDQTVHMVSTMMNAKK
jgi:hypothetical protein